MRKQKVAEHPAGGIWTMLAAPNGNSILKHHCERCGHTTLVPQNVPQNEKKAFCCGKFVTPPAETWLNRIEREQAPTYSMPIMPLPHFDRTTRE